MQGLIQWPAWNKAVSKVGSRTITTQLSTYMDYTRALAGPAPVISSPIRSTNFTCAVQS